MAKANLGRGKTMSKLVAVDGVSPGDVASASHDKVGLSLVQLGANVPSEGMVQVMLTNLGDSAVEIAAGVLRVAVIKFG